MTDEAAFTPVLLLLLLLTLQVVKAVVPALPEALLPRGLQLLPALCACLKHTNGAVRLASARSAPGLGCLLPDGVCMCKATASSMLRWLERKAYA